MSGLRTREAIERDLATAHAYQTGSGQRPSTHPLVHQMRVANDRDIKRLEAELAAAKSGELELRFVGPAFDQHKIGLPLLSRVLETLQSTFRAAYRSVSPNEHISRGEATLALAATGPGSFRLFLTTPPAQLDLLAPPLADQAMDEIVELLDAAGHGVASQMAPPWAERADEGYVRSMIRLAATLAGTQAQTSLRWVPVGHAERLVNLASDQARALAIALAGETGREILTVTGHLEMGQDQPPRVRVTTPDDDYLARVPTPELLDRVKDLLFDEVQVTLAVDMRTSPTTGRPDTEIELLDITEAT